MAFFVIISAAVFAANIRDLAVSTENRTLDLNLSALEAACVSLNVLNFYSYHYYFDSLFSFLLFWEQ